MYVRRDRQVLSDGQEQVYISLAHNVWEKMRDDKKRSRPVIFSRLGVERDLDMPTVRGMRDALDRYLRKRFGEEAVRQADQLDAAVRGEAPCMSGSAAPAGPVLAAAAELRPKLASLRFLVTVEYGLRVIVEPIWEQLGLKSAMEGFAAQHRIRFDFERVVFGMVLNRLVDPLSKLACNEWLQERAYFPEGKDWNVQHFYRALDVLQLHAEELDEAVTKAVRGRLSPSELELLLLDTTSVHFESDLDDEERADVEADWAAYDKGQRAEEPLTPRPQVLNDPPMRMRGHSKSHRPDLPQVVIATVCTKDGLILSHETYPGNTSDQAITLEMLVKVSQSDPDTQKVVVFDAGMGAEHNLETLDALPKPPHRISAVPLRNNKFGRAEVVGRPGRYRQHPSKPHLRYRVIKFTAEESPSKRPEMWIVTRNRKDAERGHRRINKHLRRVRDILSKDDGAEGHSQQVADMLGHRTLKRYVTRSEDGMRLIVNQDYVREERLLAGLHLVRTTLVDRDPVEILGCYQALLQVEDNFRTFKGPLKLRPMHHRLAHRIEAHVSLCVLSLIVLRELERRTKLSHRQLVAIFRPVKATLTEQADLQFWQRTEWDERAEEVLATLGIDPGPRTWGGVQVEPGG